MVFYYFAYASSNVADYRIIYLHMLAYKNIKCGCILPQTFKL